MSLHAAFRVSQRAVLVLSFITVFATDSDAFKMSSMLPPSQLATLRCRDKVVLPGFVRAAKDPFPHCRVSSLKAMRACGPPVMTQEDVAGKIMPVVVSMLLDVDGEVRKEVSA